MPRKSYDQRLKDRWQRRQAQQAMTAQQIRHEMEKMARLYDVGSKILSRFFFKYL